ncbi:DAN4-like protein [Fusarium acuminatum]|uniref:DAN4-like protein n=1 Tax=Fusarium acuminatum TaxID=5515 RepID=A0ABZ2XDJ6_9HYPO
MVLLKAVGAAYLAANLLGVNAGLCRPSTRTSLSLSASETSIIPTSASGSSAIPTTSVDGTTSLTDGTTAIASTTSGNPPSSSETQISSRNPTSDISTLSTVLTSSDPTTTLAVSSNPTTSSDAVTSVDSTISGSSAISAETTTSIESTFSSIPTTTAETTTSTATNTSGNPTTSAGVTTTSSEPTTTTSVCVEPTNMLRQPGFESSDQGTVWGFYWGGGGIENDPDHARSGDSLAVLPVPDGQERRMEQRIHITPGTEYTISFYYAVDSPPPSDSQCVVFATFDYYTALKQVPLPSDTEYHQYTASFISADNLDPAIEIGVSCSGVGNGYTATVYIDDTSVLDSSKECSTTPVDPNAPPKSTLLVPAQPEAPHCPVNLVQVPGFEPVNGNQAWAFFAGVGDFAQDQSNARTGEWEAVFPSGTIDNAIFLEQSIGAGNLEAGETYNFHFFWKPKTLPDNGQCYITFGYNDAVAYEFVQVNSGATSSTGYTINSIRFTMPSGNLLLQIIFYCDYYSGNQQLGSVFVDDTALVKVGGCEAYPVTGALIENPGFEIQATEDSTYAWFGTKGVSIRAGSTANGPSPNSGDNFLYVQLESTRKSATLTKPLARALQVGQSYSLQFNWSAGSTFSPGRCSFTIVFGSVSETLDLNNQNNPYQYGPFQYSFEAAEAVESMSITVSCTGTTAFPDFVFDDFSLQ